MFLHLPWSRRPGRSADPLSFPAGRTASPHLPAMERTPSHQNVSEARCTLAGPGPQTWSPYDPWCSYRDVHPEGPGDALVRRQWGDIGSHVLEDGGGHRRNRSGREGCRVGTPALNFLEQEMCELTPWMGVAAAGGGVGEGTLTTTATLTLLFTPFYFSYIAWGC